MAPYTHQTCHSFQFSCQTPTTTGFSSDKKSHAQRTSHETKKSATTITTKKSECILFILTYKPALHSISSIIRIHFCILTLSHRCYNIMKSAPIVAFRRSNNLTNFFVRAKLNFATLLLRTYIPDARSNAAVIVERAPTYPTGLLPSLPIHYTPQAKQDLLATTLPATLKALFTRNNIHAVTNKKLEDYKKIASTNTPDQLTSPPTYPNLSRYQNIFSLIITPLMTSHLFTYYRTCSFQSRQRTQS